MSENPLRKILNRVSNIGSEKPDAFLANVRGVIHVGANRGQERDLYAKHRIKVLWVEPIKEVFEELQRNIAGYDRQLAIQALVTDQNDHEYTFNISNNGGHSSSILELKDHKELWPDVNYQKSIRIRGTTLPALLTANALSPTEYDALVLDTQGSELLVLKGAFQILRSFKYIKVEVSDFEAYENCCQVSDLGEFMLASGFHEYSRHKFAGSKAVGSYFDIVYMQDE